MRIRARNYICLYGLGAVSLSPSRHESASVPLLDGAAPELRALNNGNPRYALDSRSLYANVMENWWGLRSAPVPVRTFLLLGALGTA
jgi:hypothetical protein